MISRQQIQKASQFAIHWSPLLALPLMFNVQCEQLLATHEEPKWAIFTILGIILVIAAALNALSKPSHGLTSARLPDRSITIAGAALLIFWMGLALGVTYTPNLGEGMNRLAFWSAALVTFLAVIRSIRKDEAIIQNLKVALSLSSGLLSVYFWLGFFYDFGKPDFDQFINFSRIGHFNFTADALTFLIPLHFWITIAPGHRWVRAISAFLLISCCSMLLISGSMGAMGGLLAGGLTAGTIALSLKRPPVRTSPIRPKFIWVGLTFLAAALLISKPIYNQIPAAYRDQMFVRAEWWNPPELKAIESSKSPPPFADMWMKALPFLGARTPMWASTAGMIGDHPLMGLGTGSFLFEYPGYSKRYDLFGDFETEGVVMKTNPHNILLQIASENGIPMMLLFASLYLWLLIRVLGETIQERSGFWFCAVWIMVAAGLDAMVNHIFFNPVSLFLAAVTFGLFVGRIKKSGLRGAPIPKALTGGHSIGPILAIAASLSIASFPLRWVVSEYYVAKAVRLENASPPASIRQIISTWIEARIWSPTNIQALYGLSNEAFTQKQYTVSEGYLKAMLKLAPYHSAGINMLGNIQAKTNRLDEAEQTFERALKLEPDSETVRNNLLEVRAAKSESQTAPIELKP